MWVLAFILLHSCLFDKTHPLLDTPEGNNIHEDHMPNFGLIGPACDWKVCYSPV